MTLLSDLPWPEQKKIAAWTACDPIPGLPPGDWRRDAYGSTIRRADYGKQTEYGWEVDHAHPTALGGPDALHNVRALHWRSNRSLGGLLGNLFRK